MLDLNALRGPCGLPRCRGAARQFDLRKKHRWRRAPRRRKGRFKDPPVGGINGYSRPTDRPNSTTVYGAGEETHGRGSKPRCAQISPISNRRMGPARSREKTSRNRPLELPASGRAEPSRRFCLLQRSISEPLISTYFYVFLASWSPITPNLPAFQRPPKRERNSRS